MKPRPVGTGAAANREPTEGNMDLSIFSLQGKFGIVTGGGTGIGRGIAQGLLKAGAGVAIGGRRPEVLEQAAEELRALGPPVLAVPSDVNSREGRKALIDGTMARFGRVDFLFNNAGFDRPGPSETMPWENWRLVMGVNARGPYFLARAAARAMIAGGHGGVIVNVTSVGAVRAANGIMSYNASKGALRQLTKALANEWAGHGIRVLGVGPGFFYSELNVERRKIEGWQENFCRRITMHRFAEPHEIEGVAVMLASEASSYMTGSTVYLDGGRIHL